MHCVLAFTNQQCTVVNRLIWNRHSSELKTVVCKLLVCTQPNRHETFTVLWNPYRRVSLRGRRVQIRFSRGAHSKKQKMTVRHFGFTEKVYGPLCTVHTLLLWKHHHRNVIVRILFFFYGSHSSGSSLKAGCLC